MNTFRTLHNWEDFELEWERTRVPEARIGLLYVPIRLIAEHIPDQKTRTELREKATRFLVDTAMVKEVVYGPGVTTKAKQLLVGKLLRGNMIPFSSHDFSLHESLLKFLQDPDPSLFRAPFPHAALNYLLTLKHVWQGDKNSDCHEDLKRWLQAKTNEIFRAILAWGFGDYIRTTHRQAEVVRVIKNFLRENGVESLSNSALRFDLEDPEKRYLHPKGDNRWVVSNAVYALLDMEYCVLGKQLL